MSVDRKKVQNWLIAIILIIWPFIFLFPYVFPINGKYLLIGSDFTYLYYKYKVYFLAFINASHFPLWSPSEGSGFPFYSSPFGQVLYPLNIFLVLFYRIAGGLSVLDYQRFSVLGISIFSVGTFLWLRSLKIKTQAALISALVMSVSFKLVVDIRFPNAVHSACWYPWILYSITKIASARSNKIAILFGGLFVFSLFSLMTGGYPYYLYYSIFLILPYAIFTIIPFFRNRVFRFPDNNLKRTWITYISAGAILLILGGPYIFQMYKMLGQTLTRSGGDWAFSIFRLFGPVDTVGSLIYPMGSYDEGWYHFGLLGLLLIIIFLFGKDIPGNDDTSFNLNNRITKYLLITWYLLITYISWGKDSYLFAFLWRFLPGFSSLRQWGRLNIILVPLFAWLLALAIQYFLELIGHSTEIRSFQSAIRRGIWVLNAAYVIILGIQAAYVLEHYHNFYWTYYFIPNLTKALSWPFQAIGQHVPSLGTINHIYIYLFIVFGLLAFLVSLFLLLKAQRGKIYPTLAVMMVLLILSGLNEYIGGPWMWANGWDIIQPRTVMSVINVDIDSFNFPRTRNYDSLSLNPVFNVGTFNNWYYSRYLTFLSFAQAEPGAASIFLGLKDGQKLYFSTSINPINIQAFLNDSGRFSQIIKVNSYNGDVLNLRVNAPVDGYISFIDNWDSNWKATVDDHLVQIELLFGTFKSLKIPVGVHSVIFAYCPPIFQVLNPECTNMR